MITVSLELSMTIDGRPADAAEVAGVIGQPIHEIRESTKGGKPDVEMVVYSMNVERDG